MTSTRAPTVEAVPNVLQDQTIPNTLNGVGPQAPAARPRPSGRLLVVIGAAIAAVAAYAVARVA
jgi:hypothetical protein